MQLSKSILFSLIISLSTWSSLSQGIQYPFPVKYIDLRVQAQQVKMAYMDEVSLGANGKTVLFFHGKNFNGYYWKEIMTSLIRAGYRVINADQVGWGKSAKPRLEYSFNMLADNNLQLLDSLKIDSVILIGHSMGGMLAVRFALNYPNRVQKIVLENPIGLEDYKLFIPPQAIGKLHQKELKANYASYKKYQQSYYPVWRPEYEQYVKVQAEALKYKDFSAVAYINALTYQMIYDQPIVNEMQNIQIPTLLVIGQEDRTVVGKDLLPKHKQALYGNYPQLGKLANQKIKGSKLIELKGVGHIPHIQAPGLFTKHLLEFLQD